MIISGTNINLYFANDGTAPRAGDTSSVFITEGEGDSFSVQVPWSRPKAGLLWSTHDPLNKSHRDNVDTSVFFIKEAAADYLNTMCGLVKGLKFGLKWDDEDYMPLDHYGEEDGEFAKKFRRAKQGRVFIYGEICQMYLQVFLTSYRGARRAFLIEVGKGLNMPEDNSVSILTQSKCIMSVDYEDPDEIPIIGCLCYQYMLHPSIRQSLITIGDGTFSDVT